jgi:hypothetical protein
MNEKSLETATRYFCDVGVTLLQPIITMNDAVTRNWQLQAKVFHSSSFSASTFSFRSLRKEIRQFCAASDM